MGRIQKVDSISGTGDVYRGKAKLCRVQYQLTVYQETIDAGTTEVPGLMEIRGSVSARAEDIGAMFSVDKLSLQLQDGRWLDFFLKNTRGDLTGTGGFYTRDW